MDTIRYTRSTTENDGKPLLYELVIYYSHDSTSTMYADLLFDSMPASDSFVFNLVVYRLRRSYKLIGDSLDK